MKRRILKIAQASGSLIVAAAVAVLVAGILFAGGHVISLVLPNHRPRKPTSQNLHRYAHTKRPFTTSRWVVIFDEHRLACLLYIYTGAIGCFQPCRKAASRTIIDIDIAASMLGDEFQKADATSPWLGIN
jgi:hypothetical protein